MQIKNIEYCWNYTDVKSRNSEAKPALRPGFLRQITHGRVRDRRGPRLEEAGY